MEKIIYKTGITEIIKDVTDMKCDELLNHFITIMQMLGHSDDNIGKAVNERSDDKFIL